MPSETHSERIPRRSQGCPKVPISLPSSRIKATAEPPGPGNPISTGSRAAQTHYTRSLYCKMNGQAILAQDGHSRRAPRWPQGGPKVPKSFPPWLFKAKGQASVAQESHSRRAPTRSQSSSKVPNSKPLLHYKAKGAPPWTRKPTPHGFHGGPKVVPKSQTHYPRGA